MRLEAWQVVSDADVFSVSVFRFADDSTRLDSAKFASRDDRYRYRPFPSLSTVMSRETWNQFGDVSLRFLVRPLRRAIPARRAATVI